LLLKHNLSQKPTSLKTTSKIAPTKERVHQEVEWLVLRPFPHFKVLRRRVGPQFLGTKKHEMTKEISPSSFV
jgi:hypothetical protein